MNIQRPWLILPISVALISCTPAQQNTKPQTNTAPANSQPAVSKQAATESKAPVNAGPAGLDDLSKAGFRYSDGRDWPRINFDPTVTGALLAEQTPQKTASDSLCATAQAAAPMDAGPKQNWAVKKAAGMIGGMLGGFLGGGGGDAEPPRPATVNNPLEKLTSQPFSMPDSGADLQLAGQLTDKGLLLNTLIDDAPGKPTFHRIYLERPDCQRAWPNRYLVYKLWLEWSLSVSWTRTRTQYRNGEQISQQKSSGGFNRSGEKLLDQGAINLSQPQNLSDYHRSLLANAPPPVWQQLGFNGPEAGVRELGSQFSDVTAAQLEQGTVAVVHISRPAGGRYTTEAKAFRMKTDATGAVKFTPL